jgi:hypothetical protein
VLVLLGAAVWRMNSLTEVPPGLHPDEVTEIRLIETARRGRIEVFYDIGGAGYEGLYPAISAAVTSALGGGVIGYRMVGVLAGFLSIALLYAVGKRRLPSSSPVLEQTANGCLARWRACWRRRC